MIKMSRLRDKIDRYTLKKERIAKLKNYKMKNPDSLGTRIINIET
jgi:hypothetical protein